MLQSRHCCFQDVSQSSKFIMSAMSSFDSLLSSMISFVRLKTWMKDSLFGWLSNFSINCLTLSLRCVTCCSTAEIHQELCSPRSCARFPKAILIRLVGHMMFVRLVLLDLVDQCFTTRGTLGVKRTLWKKLICRLHAHHFLNANSW